MSDFIFDFVFLPLVATACGAIWAAAMTWMLCRDAVIRWNRRKAIGTLLAKKRRERSDINAELESAVIWRRDGFAILSIGPWKHVCKEKRGVGLRFVFIDRFATCDGATRRFQELCREANHG